MSTIVLVDDDNELSKIIAGKLRELGHSVKRHGSCAGAIDVIREIRPGIVVLDVMLGDGAGYQLARQIRQDPALFATPILFMSALGDDHEIRHAMEQGADDYLVKPFGVEALAAKVEGLERLRESITQLAAPANLPSLDAMMRQIDHRLVRKEGLAVCCVQVVGLDGYKEKHGPLGEISVLRFMANILVQEIRAIGVKDCYLSHAGGEFFLALISLDDYDRFTQNLVSAFKIKLRSLYTKTELAREEMIMAGITGKALESLMLALRISVVHTRSRTFSNARHLLQVLAETHALTAGCGGNVIFVDRKQDYHGPVFGMPPGPAAPTRS